MAAARWGFSGSLWEAAVVLYSHSVTQMLVDNHCTPAEKGLCVYTRVNTIQSIVHTQVPMCLCWSVHCKRKKTVMGNYT